MDDGGTEGGAITGRERKARLRAKRDAEGMAQVSGWVPKDRRPFARKVLVAIARGANTLPPDPEQAAALAAARAEAEMVRGELAQAGERAQALATEAAAALARAERAEWGREEATRDAAAARVEVEAAQGRERAAQEAADALRGKLAGTKGWRGLLLRFAGVSRL